MTEMSVSKFIKKQWVLRLWEGVSVDSVASSLTRIPAGATIASVDDEDDGSCVAVTFEKTEKAP